MPAMVSALSEVAEAPTHACRSRVVQVCDEPGGAIVGYLRRGAAVSVSDTCSGWMHVEVAEGERTARGRMGRSKNALFLANA